jgi:hypothetical protein
MLRNLIFGLLTFCIASCQSVWGQTVNPYPKPIDPPYIARTSNFMAIAFQLEANEVQKLLPANVKVKRDHKGFANAGMEMYTTDQIYGMPKYTIAFIYVEVSVPESGNDTSGNWPIWGVVDNDTALNTLRHFYHYPYQQEKNILFQTAEEQVITIGGSKGEGLTLKLKRNRDKPVTAEGVARLLSSSGNGGVVKTDIPWLAAGHQASIVSFEVRPGSNKILQMIQGAKPFYGQVSANVFSYSIPISR